MSAGTWERFEQDPRHPQASRLRASDRDRDLALDVLAQAFADGRLDRTEYDDRAGVVTTAKLLGDLVPPLEDLVPSTALAARVSGAPARADVHQQAVRRWAAERREALNGLVVVSFITWTIWAVTMYGGFAWPLFPTLAAAVHLMRTQLRRTDIVEEHERKILKREAKMLRERPQDEG